MHTTSSHAARSHFVKFGITWLHDKTHASHGPRSLNLREHYNSLSTPSILDNMHVTSHQIHYEYTITHALLQNIVRIHSHVNPDLWMRRHRKLANVTDVTFIRTKRGCVVFLARTECVRFICDDLLTVEQIE